MKTKILIAGLMTSALSVLTASAWNVSGVVSCPAGNSAAGIVVSVAGVGSTTTVADGAFLLELPDTPATYAIWVDTNSLPAGATVSGMTTFSVDNNNEFASVNFTLDGPFCTPPPPTGSCWLTGGGTIGKTKGQPDYSYGGVVNPGCSPIAAGGGNWNVVDHLQGLHFQGQLINVIACGGSSDKAPKVNVNTIDFQGTGIISGVGGNTLAKTPVCFTGHAEDHGEPGAGKDALYLRVYDCNTGTTLMLISTDPGNPLDVAPVNVSTGNLQIHTSGCGK